MTKLAKAGFARPGNDEIGQLREFGQIVGEAHLRTANYHSRLRRYALQQFDHPNENLLRSYNAL